MRCLNEEDVGVVERAGDESIVTSFVVALMPLWPRASFYLSPCREGGVHRIPIQLHRRSVVLGYLRRPLWFAAVVLGAPGAEDPVARWPFLVVGVTLAIVAAILTFRAGRLAPRERERRDRLRRVAGFGAPPELLAPELAARIRDDLVELWSSGNREAWHAAIIRGHASELLVTLAEYHGSPALADQAQINLGRLN
jgi:hypothetical protein